MDKILICGSLEPGRDGVGDYSRRLGAELIRQKFDIGIIAYMDRYVDSISFSDQVEDGISIPVLRLGKKLSRKKRNDTAKKWIKQLDPKWLSLQFVPYSYHRKGLPWRLANDLMKLGKGRSWHFMFHELWIEDRDIKEKVIAILQRCIIQYLAKQLKPSVIHTHLPVYKVRLENIFKEVNMLPVFSNFKTSGAIRKKADVELINIAFFSQLTYRPSIIIFLERLTREIFMEGLDVKILLIGGNTNKSEQLEKELVRIPGVYYKVFSTGFLDNKSLSEELRKCDLAVTPVPRHVLGKSGSVAAFLSQGIPVAAPYLKPGYENEKIGFFTKTSRAAILTDPTWAAFQIARMAAKDAPRDFDITTIADRFVADLNKKATAEYSLSTTFS